MCWSDLALVEFGGSRCWDFGDLPVVQSETGFKSGPSEQLKSQPYPPHVQ